MNKEYVQAYVTLERSHWWFAVRQKILLRILKKHLPVKSLQVLNIGAAGGASTDWLRAFGQVQSVEQDPQFFAHLQQLGYTVTEASIADMPFGENQFDLVCAFDVLEHVEDEKAAWKEMARVCKPGGIVCVTVPAFAMLWSTHDEINGHKRRYTYNSLLKSASSTLLINKELRYFNFLLFLPILLYRKLVGLFPSEKSKNGSDFEVFAPRSFASVIFGKVFAAELPLMRIIRFPFGVSLLSVWKK